MAEHKWCAIDAEGDVGDKGLLGVAFYSEALQAYITDHDAIKDALLDMAESGHTFLAHNAEYDLSVIFWQLHIPMKAVYYNKVFNRGEWKYHKKRPYCQLWDTLSLSGMISLERLGLAIGIPKYPTPQTLLGKDPDRYVWQCERHLTWECEECYAIRDAEIVYRFMLEFATTLAGWSVKPQRRLGTAAINTWRTLDNPHPVNIKEKHVKELSRQAYYGGRVEALKIGTLQGVHHADVQSMYPSVMLSTPMPDPTKLMMLYEPRLAAINWSVEGVADVEVYVPPMYLAPLPLAYENKRCFPVGLMRGTWTTLELRYATSLGCDIRHVYSMAFSTATLSPFTTYIMTLWELRKQLKRDNDPREIVVKLLLNNLYGRLGMNEDLEEERVFIMPDGAVLSDYPGCNGRLIDGSMFIHEPRRVQRRANADNPLLELAGEIPADKIYSPNQWANVMWAAYVTSAARVKLHRLMHLQGANAVYCDTDSVFSTAPIIGLGSGLGELELEDTYTSMLIAGPKLYTTERHDGTRVTKAKGVARSVAERFIRGERVSYPSPVKPRTQQLRGIAAGTWIEITRQRQLVPGSRHLLNPLVTTNHDLVSDTTPLVSAPSGELLEYD